MQYDKVCLETFLEKQSKLFDEPVAETLEEAEALKKKLYEILACLSS